MSAEALLDVLGSTVSDFEVKTHDDSLGSVKSEALVKKQLNTPKNYTMTHFRKTRRCEGRGKRRHTGQRWRQRTLTTKWA